MGIHNGFVTGLNLNHRGDQSWSDHTDWSTWDTWTEYTDTTVEIKTGAVGRSLRYQTDILDLGSSRYVYPEITVGCVGTPRIVIEYGDASDLSDATTQGSYTSNNDEDGSSVYQTYTILDLLTPGYTDDDYTGFKARYVRITVYVERFIWDFPRLPLPFLSPNVINGIYTGIFGRFFPSIFNLNIAFKNDMQTEEQFDVAVSGETHTLTTTDIETITGIQMTAHSEANKKLVPQIVSKANKQIRVIDANTFSTAAVDATVDIAMTGLPEVQVYENGNIGRRL